VRRDKDKELPICLVLHGTALVSAGERNGFIASRYGGKNGIPAP
jgi:hypothetical protein